MQKTQALVPEERDESEKILETSKKIESTVDQVLTSITEARTDAAEYGDQLQSLTTQIPGKDGQDIKKLVRGLLDETQRMADRNQALEGRLKESSSQITELKNNVESYRQQAMTDALTGLANRMHFDLRLRECTDTAAANGEPVCLLMIDVDFFKNFNDRFGHQVGDQVLRLVAQTMRNGVKGRDLVARYGGEEFAVILPHTRLDDAANVADQLRDSMASKKLVRKNSKSDLGTVTLSVGVSAYRHGENIADLISRADQAVYVAKRNGRNRVELEEAAEPRLAAG